jgi:hypothetical protein
VALVRERTIPTERQPLVGEVNENLLIYLRREIILNRILKELDVVYKLACGGHPLAIDDIEYRTFVNLGINFSSL